MKIAYMSLGCKVNLYECEALINEFINAGFELVPFNEVADVYLINTCTVTQTSDSKSRKMIRQAVKHNEKGIVCVMGCFSQLHPLEVLEISGVKVVCGSSNRHLIFPKVMEIINSENNDSIINLTQSYNEIKDYEDLVCNKYLDKTRGFVKIQDGCENFCSYCAIPYSRGRFRSRPKESIINEIKHLTENNVKEIVLSGINTGAYGKDLDNYNLVKLLKDLLDNVPLLCRIRISSIEVTEISEELLELLKLYPQHFCLHLHIPLQGGSDEILAKMKRKYDTKTYLEYITMIRKYLPEINITADVLVGFNGETDELFNKAYDFIKSIGYGEIHVFPYSPRPNTVAYLESKKIKFIDRVDGITQKYRVNQLLELNEINGLKYREQFLNKELDVLVEKIEKGIAFGHSSNYLEVTFPVIKAKVNDLVLVKIIKIGYPISEGVEQNVL